MILIIGGYAQGKLGYVKRKYNICNEDIYDFEKSDDFDFEKNTTEVMSDRQLVFYNVNYLIKKATEDGYNIDVRLEKLINNYPNAIIVTDEVGNGVVPIDKNERLLREKIGRIQCMMAERADEVIRVVCGIGQKIK